MAHLNLPVVVVTCIRDLPMLFLQAESMEMYYNRWLLTNLPKTKLYIVVNEPDDQLDTWYTGFNHIKSKYSQFDLTIIPRSQFKINWSTWVPSTKNPWAVGWETQQVLKLVVAERISEPGYFLLDSQNFLTNHWGTIMYPVPDGRMPYRSSNFSMPESIWTDYSSSLEIPGSASKENVLSICTPLFLHTELVKSLVFSKSTLNEFAKWFKSASRIKSEFTLYYLWGEKHGGFDKYHYQCSDWAGNYLRDHNHFDTEFDRFVLQIGQLPGQAWESINHRAWGEMTTAQYTMLTDALKGRHLFGDHFEEYRKHYISYSF